MSGEGLPNANYNHLFNIFFFVVPSNASGQTDPSRVSNTTVK